MALVPPHARALPSLAVSGHIKVSLNSICKWNLTLHFRGRTPNAFCFFALSSFEGNKIFDVSFEMQCTSNDLHHSVFPFESRLAIISRHNIYKKNNAKMLCIFQELHFHVLMYSYNISVTGRVPNLREPPQGRSVRLDVLPILELSPRPSCRSWEAHPTVESIWPILLIEESRGDDILAEGVDGGWDGLPWVVEVGDVVSVDGLLLLSAIGK